MFRLDLSRSRIGSRFPAFQGALTKASRHGIVPLCGRLAQLVRAPRLHRGCRGFKSLSAQMKSPFAALRTGFHILYGAEGFEGSTRRASCDSMSTKRGKRARKASASVDPGPEARGTTPRAGGQIPQRPDETRWTSRPVGFLYLGSAPRRRLFSPGSLTSCSVDFEGAGAYN